MRPGNAAGRTADRPGHDASVRYLPPRRRAATGRPGRPVPASGRRADQACAQGYHSGVNRLW
jgi:hypothetical protein